MPWAFGSCLNRMVQREGFLIVGGNVSYGFLVRFTFAGGSPASLLTVPGGSLRGQMDALCIAETRMLRVRLGRSGASRRLVTGITAPT